ncbi:MAG: hypothetical protein ACEQR8_11375 [Cypionkella sp.]
MNSRTALVVIAPGEAIGDGTVRHYRINKVTAPGGRTLKKRDVLAQSDAEAVQTAAESDECPVCEVLRDGRTIGIVA